MFSYRVDNDLELHPVSLRFVDDYVSVIEKNLSHLSKWMPWAEKFTRQSLEAFITRSLEQQAKDDGFQCAIFYKGKLVGTIGFHAMDRANKKTSLGYWIDKDAQGKGIVSKATKALVEYAFDVEKMNRIEIRCGVENVKSRAIPERLGFKLEGISRQTEVFNDRIIDHAVYSMISHEWKK